MSRRPHKKSRHGCADCKRRHIRCDEARPACGNCQRAELRCSFIDPNEAFIVPVKFDLPKDSPTSSGPRKRSSSHLHSTFENRNAADPGPTIDDLHEEYVVNMTHMQLMHNMTTESYNSVELLGKGSIPRGLFAKHALTTPYIMNQRLASSALHLAATKPTSEAFWRKYATGLQHQALAIFNAAHPDLQVTAENCETMFLWSSLLGVQSLSEVFLFQRDSVKAFMDAFTNGMKLYRGVLIVIDQCKDLLFQTETGGYLKNSGLLLKTTSSRDGPECEILKRMIEDITMGTEDEQACLAATLELQHIINAQNALPGSQIVIPIIMAWPILLTPDYVRLLHDLQPQALIIFAHFAVLLHRAKNLWIIGSGGEFLIRSICELLGQEWHKYLDFPKSALQEPMVTNTSDAQADQ